VTLFPAFKSNASVRLQLEESPPESQLKTRTRTSLAMVT
jgi:hypothetical protein